MLACPPTKYKKKGCKQDDQLVGKIIQWELGLNSSIQNDKMNSQKDSAVFKINKDYKISTS